VKHIRTIIVSTAFLVPALACAGGDSSDGHTHGGAVPPEVIAEVAPRTSAQSDEFELVAVLADGKLTLYLDRYTDNAPVPDAEVEVESGPSRPSRPRSRRACMRCRARPSPNPASTR
jgi:cobalt-zinc-cadmium efflux system membrane fusion protein